MADRDARLDDFLSDPCENREVEKVLARPGRRTHPGMAARHRAVLANHGGGRLQFGFSEQANGSFLDKGIARPDPRNCSTDAVNSVVARHATPRFHCPCRDRT